MAPPKFRVAKVALGLLIVFLVVIIGAANSGRYRSFFLSMQSIPGGDKFGHFVLFGILSFLVNLLLRAASFRLAGIRFLKGSSIVLFIVTLEECSQIFFKSRTFDLLDLAAGAVGIWLFGQMAALYLRRTHSAFRRKC